MDKYTAREVVMRILRRDYERWVAYADECIKDRGSYTKSFYVWKEEKKLMEKDVETIVDALID